MCVVEEMIYRPFIYTEQNGYLKVLIRCVLGIDGRRRGGGWIVALPPIYFD